VTGIGVERRLVVGPQKWANKAFSICLLCNMKHSDPEYVLYPEDWPMFRRVTGRYLEDKNACIIRIRNLLRDYGKGSAYNLSLNYSYP
jgi:hypothetical protein